MRLSRLVGLTERRLARRAGFSRILSCGFCLLGNRQKQMLPFLPRNGDWNRFCQLSAQQKRRLLPRAEFILHSRALPADGFPAYLHICLLYTSDAADEL